MKQFDSQSIYYAVAAATTILGISYKVSKVVWKFFKTEFRSIQEDRERLRTVFAELTPNHGSSMKDKMNKLEQAMARNTELTEAIFFRQRWVMESQTVPVFEADKDGLFTWVNEEFAHFFGKSTNLFLGNGWKTVIFHEDLAKVEQRWNDAVKQKIPCEVQFRVWINDKSVIVKLSAQRNESGYIGSILVIKKKITAAEQKPE